MKGYVHTIFVPSEAVAQLLSLELHVEANGHEHFRLVGVVVDRTRVKVVVAAKQVIVLVELIWLFLSFI